jgi:hypothetical protein
MNKNYKRFLKKLLVMFLLFKKIVKDLKTPYFKQIFNINLNIII